MVSHSDAQANQTLLVIDSQQRHRNHTGDKVKSLMPDDIAQSIVSETILVPLRKGDKYNQAFLDASDRLVALLSGKPDPGPPQIAEIVKTEGTFKEPKKPTLAMLLWVIGLLLAATIIPWQLTTCMSGEDIPNPERTLVQLLEQSQPGQIPDLNRLHGLSVTGHGWGLLKICIQISFAFSH